MVTEYGIQPSIDHIDIIQGILPPRYVTQVKYFVHMVGYYREFIWHFAEMSEPLVRLTRKYVPFQWGWEENDSFLKLKNGLVTYPVLRYPDLRKMSFMMATYASNVACGAVIEQPDENGRLHPRCLLFHALSMTQK